MVYMVHLQPVSPYLFEMSLFNRLFCVNQFRLSRLRRPFGSQVLEWTLCKGPRGVFGK